MSDQPATFLEMYRIGPGCGSIPSSCRSLTHTCAPCEGVNCLGRRVYVGCCVLRPLGSVLKRVSASARAWVWGCKSLIHTCSPGEVVRWGGRQVCVGCGMLRPRGSILERVSTCARAWAWEGHVRAVGRWAWGPRYSSRGAGRSGVCPGAGQSRTRRWPSASSCSCGCSTPTPRGVWRRRSIRCRPRAPATCPLWGSGKRR